MRHAGPLALFAALAVAWSWPLARHLGDALPGAPGDNYSFVWNLWWMRHVIATPGLAYFRTDYLFYPLGTSIADHPHTALPALIAATVLNRASVVTAQNLLLLSYIFANMACAYALVWDITRHRRGAILGGVIFGLSPYLAAHLLGHFDLMAAWLLPLFALALRRGLASNSTPWTIGAGLVLVATAYTAYYYVVYLSVLLAVYLAAWLGWRPIAWRRRVQSATTRAMRRGLIVLIAVLSAIAVWIVATGGQTLSVGGTVVGMRTPQNALTGIWICAIAYACCIWRASIRPQPDRPERVQRAMWTGASIVAVFAVGAAPLLWQAAELVMRGEYVTPAYQWRSAPRGVDLAAPLLGPPLARVSAHIYEAAHLDRIEAVGWLGVVPLVLLASALMTGKARRDQELHIWRAVGALFAVWALGPVLTVAGFDTGLKLPATLLRYVPFVANARMPGRAIVCVYLALAVLGGAALAAERSRWRRPIVQWLMIAFVAFEYWDAPILMTPLDRPAVYEALASAPAGGVCEVPLGIGDGLSVGVGSQDRVSLYYATIHEHPLVGGYIGRMPVDAARRYEQMPVVGALLSLSDGRSAAGPAGADGSACRYLVVNRAATSAPLSAYLRQLPLERITSHAERELYRLNLRP